MQPLLTPITSVQNVPDPSDASTWLFQIMMSWTDQALPASEDNFPGRMRFFKKRAEGYAEPWYSAGRAVREDRELVIDKGAYWESAKKWNNRGGRMTLVGDAAHPMTPRKCSSSRIRCFSLLCPTHMLMYTHRSWPGPQQRPTGLFQLCLCDNICCKW